MKIKIFWQENCPKCPRAKEMGKILAREFEVEYYDINTVDGLTEACLYQVMSTPTILIVNEKGEVKAPWRGVLPEIENIRQQISELQ